MLYKILDILIWPAFVAITIFLIARNIETFEKIWKITWSPISSLKSGLKVSVLGQSIQFIPEDFTKIANITKVNIRKFFPEETILEAIPYISKEIDEKTMNYLNILEELGVIIEKIEDLLILCYVGSYHYLNSEYEKSLKYYKLALQKMQKPKKLSEGKANEISAISCCIGWNLSHLGELSSAINYFNDAIRKNRQNAWAYLGKFAIYKGKQEKVEVTDNVKNETVQNYEQAQRYFQMRTKSNFLDHMSYCGLASLYFYNNEYDEAILKFDEAIKIKESPLAYYNRAICKIKKFNLAPKDDDNSQIKGALSDLFKAIAEYPLLRNHAIGDKDFEELYKHECYQCFVEHNNLANLK